MKELNTDKEIKNIAICIPSTDHFTADFSMCLAQLCHLTHHRLAFVNTRSSYIDDNRNKAVLTVMHANAGLMRKDQISHILFLDNDLIFPLDIIDRLLAHDKSIVGGAYPVRVPPHVLCYSPLKTRAGLEEPGLLEVAGLPTGTMLIDMHVFTQIPRPWFKKSYYRRDEIEAGDICPEAANALRKFFAELFADLNLDELDFPVPISDDFWFCALARQAGYGVWLDTELTKELQHVGQRALTFYDSFNWRKEAGLTRVAE
jgi:hypothetical protein